MIRRKGIAGFVGNSIHWIKGVFKPSYSVTSITVDPPTLTIGLMSIINITGLGALSTITGGQGVLSTITATSGFSSIIQTSGKGVLSQITQTGQGVTSS